MKRNRTSTTRSKPLAPGTPPRQRVFVYLTGSNKEELLDLLHRLRRHGVRLSQTEYFEKLYTRALPHLKRAAKLSPGDPHAATALNEIFSDPAKVNHESSSTKARTKGQESLASLSHATTARHFVDMPGEQTAHLAFLAGQESIINPLLAYITNYNELQRQQGSPHKHTKTTVLKMALQRFLDFEYAQRPELFASPNK